MTKVALIEVAEANFRHGRRALAIDVARAVSESRLSWETERRLRSLDTAAAGALFDRLAADVGDGAAFSRVAAWLTANA